MLSGMGIAHDSEVLTQDKLFSIDIVLRHSQTAIEVDGDSHFALNTRRPSGMTFARAEMKAARTCGLPAQLAVLWPFTHTVPRMAAAGIWKAVLA